MAKKAKKRTMAARIVLTVHAYKAVEEAAFRNCRTVSQELSYRIERQIEAKSPQEPIYAPITRYDEPAASQEPRLALEAPLAALPPARWTQAQEDSIYALGKETGLAESQITALRLIHKHFEAVKTAIETERVPA